MEKPRIKEAATVITDFLMGGDRVIPRIKCVKPQKKYVLRVSFDDGKDCLYDVQDDINRIAQYKDLETVHGLFEQARLDESRTCVFWNDNIDLPSDIIYEYGEPIPKNYS